VATLTSVSLVTAQYGLNIVPVTDKLAEASRLFQGVLDLVPNTDLNAYQGLYTDARGLVNATDQANLPDDAAITQHYPSNSFYGARGRWAGAQPHW